MDTLGKFGDGDPRFVDETGRPLVSIREAATIVADYRGSLTQTCIQRSMLSEQLYKLKDQQKEIEQMEQMKSQLQMGRAITNLVSNYILPYLRENTHTSRPTFV